MKIQCVFKTEEGVTLLELLIVITVLAILAGGVILSLGSVEEDAALRLSQSEMQEIKKSVLRFRQDTGFLPKQGPFDLAPPNGGGVVPLPSEGVDWFRSSANFDQLYRNPLTGTGHPLESWNPNTARGWRGPYLTVHGEGLVDVGNNLGTDGTGSPVAGTVVANVRGVADPFIASPAGAYLVWRSSTAAASHDRWGRPYFLFALNNLNQARIVGMGPNRAYDGGTSTSDDLVLYLFR
ncbi:MAG: type II secretion system GspH family protein [Candidatus Manganitrophus sp. SA1]|nr:type II secretion system GspH family protein [Candidatus Manganitrophus morganii]